MKKVLDWPTSKEIKDIQKFLGFTNYYQYFIKDFIVIIQFGEKRSKVELDRKIRRDVQRASGKHISTVHFLSINKAYLT